MNEPAVRLEEQIISLFSDRETFLCQGWILKRGERYLSVYPLYYRPAEQDIPEKIERCEEIAGQCGLDCVFRIAERTNYYLSALLSDNGYTIKRCGMVAEWNLPGNPDRAPKEVKTAECPVMENDRYVGIRKREVLFLQGEEFRNGPAPADILRFSRKNGVARIVADLPAEDGIAEEYELAGFRRVYNYCIYGKSAARPES